VPAPFEPPEADDDEEPAEDADALDVLDELEAVDVFPELPHAASTATSRPTATDPALTRPIIPTPSNVPPWRGS
jgi:hypothetical protein